MHADSGSQLNATPIVVCLLRLEANCYSTAEHSTRPRSPAAPNQGVLVPCFLFSGMFAIKKHLLQNGWSIIMDRIII